METEDFEGAGAQLANKAKNFWLNLDGDTSHGAHYSILKLIDEPDEGMAALRQLFAAGPDELNFVLFSTSGIHGTYCSIEDCEKGESDSVTFLVVQPRLVCLRFGNCRPTTPDDFEFLRQLRALSWNVVQSIGR